jgi:hypothetical protein
LIEWIEKRTKTLTQWFLTTLIGLRWTNENKWRDGQRKLPFSLTSRTSCAQRRPRARLWVRLASVLSWLLCSSCPAQARTRPLAQRYPRSRTSVSNTGPGKMRLDSFRSTGSDARPRHRSVIILNRQWLALSWLPIQTSSGQSPYARTISFPNGRWRMLLAFSAEDEWTSGSFGYAICSTSGGFPFFSRAAKAHRGFLSRPRAAPDERPRRDGRCQW